MIEQYIPNPNPDFSQLLTVLTRSGKPDYIPFYELFVNNEVMEPVIGKPITDRLSTLEFYYKAGYDYVPAWPTFSMKTGSHNVASVGPITNRAEFDAYDWPRVEDLGYGEFDALIPELPAGMKIIGQTGGIFEISKCLMGYEMMCYALADDPGFVWDIFEKVGSFYTVMYDRMAAIPEVGAIVISDDLGFKTQPLLSPGDIRKYVLPWHKQLADAAHRHGKPCILHSCGNLESVMDDIIDYVGIDAKHSYEDAIMPVTNAHAKYGSRIAVLGGFDMDRLCRSSTEEVRKYTLHLIKQIGGNGSYALGSGNSVAKYVPAENYLTMLGTAWRACGRD